MINKNIPTIILCGGMGTRLREETEFKPKPMVLIGNKPLLWHIMKIYAHHGYRDFILALGYKGDCIKDYLLGDHSLEENNFRIISADTGLETPHGERVLKLKNYISGDLFMVTYGDGVADIDIDRLIEFHKAKNKIATITGVHPTSRWGLVKVDSGDLVTQFDQKPVLYDYVNGGFMVFKKEFFNFLKPGDMIEDALTRLAAQGQVALYKHEKFWYGMDTYRDFLELNKLWEESPKWKIWET
jgi:glucose-1-phosphate cytidylyltransferase